MTPTVGLLAPLEPLAPEYERVLAESGCVAVTAVTPADDSHEVGAVLAAGSRDALAAAAHELGKEAALVVWACTSGSFAGGLDGARRQHGWLAEAAGVPVTTTALALLDALAALGAAEVSVCSPYPAPLTDRLLGFLDQAGVTIAGLRTLPTAGPSVSQRLGAGDLAGPVGELAREAPGTLVVVPDTAIPGCALWPALAPAGRVILANQWTLWSALTSLGLPAGHAALGPLREVAPKAVVP